MPTNLTKYPRPPLLKGLIDCVEKKIPHQGIRDLFKVLRTMYDSQGKKILTPEAEFVFFYQLIKWEQPELFKKIVSDHAIFLTNYDEFTYSPSFESRNYQHANTSHQKSEAFNLFELAIIQFAITLGDNEFIYYLFCEGLRPNRSEQKAVKWCTNSEYEDLMNIHSATELSSLL
jgi:hypothetical protein